MVDELTMFWAKIATQLRQQFCIQNHGSRCYNISMADRGSDTGLTIASCLYTFFTIWVLVSPNGLAIEILETFAAISPLGREMTLGIFAILAIPAFIITFLAIIGKLSSR